MPGQFDKETTRQNFEWHRERALREKHRPSAESANRVEYNIREIATKHGDKAAKEIIKEFKSKGRSKERKYFT